MQADRQVQQALAALEADASLLDEISFGARAMAIDYLEFRILDPIRHLPEGAGDGRGLWALRRRAARLKRRLEGVDHAFMQWFGSA